MPGCVDLVAAHVVDADLPLHRVRVPHLDDAIDEGPEEVHRHRFVDALVDRVQDETEVRLRPRGDDLEELRDRLRRVVQEQGRDRVEVDPDRRAQLLRGLAHRHADPLEVAEARDEERLLARGRFGSVRRGRAVAVDEHERLSLVHCQVEVERLRPRADFVRRHVEGHEDDALAEPQVLLTLEKRKKATPEELRAAGKFRELVEVMNAASWLQAKGLVTMKERVVHTYRLARPDAARRPLPERKALRALIKAPGPLSVS